MSHIVPINGSKAPALRTGYEAVLPYRVSDKYVMHATADGVVNNVTDKYVEILYKDNAKPTKYTLKEWYTKEEAGTTYGHKLITDLKKGAKIKYGEVIIYDPAFFEPDMFDMKKVIFKSSTSMNVALMEDIQTYEDSATISKEAAKKLATTVTKVKSIVVNSSDEIVDIVKVKQKVIPSDILFSITDASIMKLKGLSPEVLESLKRLKKSSPKVKYNGVIDKIVIYYNDEYDDLSDTLKKLVDVSDKEIQHTYNNNKYTGRVDSSYSIQGKPLRPGQVEIKIYININENMGIGDKAIIASQLKNTIGEVYEYDMLTEDNTPIDMVFSLRSISARIVNSPLIIGTTTKTLEVLGKRAVDMYFGKQ